MDYLIVMGVIICIWIAIRESRDRAYRGLVKREQHAAAAVKSVLEKRLAKYPEPAYALSEDSELAEVEQETIEFEGLSWDCFEIDEADVLEPFEAAGDALTPELREAIVEDARRELFLEEIAAAKHRAAQELETCRRQGLADRQSEIEAKNRLAEFVSRTRPSK